MTDAPGLQWVQSTDAYTRLGALSGMTLAQAIAYCNVTMPWSQMRRCNLLDNGVVSAFYNGGVGCYSDTNVATMGQCMVDIECFDYYTDFTTAGTYIWYIQPHGAGMTVGGSSVTWKTYPAFIRNGVTKDRIFMGAYESYFNATTSKLESKAGVQPTGSHTLSQFRTAAQLRKGAANYWEIQDYLSTCGVQLLYLLEYGGFNSQTLLGDGVTNITDDAATNMAINTGYTSSLGNASGQVAVTHYQTAQATHAMSYRGIENFYGNIAKWVDGINIKANDNPWIADHGFASDTFDGTIYKDTTLTLLNANGWPGNIATTATIDYGFLASATGGSATTKLCDYYYRAAGNNLPYFGGRWDYTTSAGAFIWALNANSTTTDRRIGTRLLYVG